MCGDGDFMGCGCLFEEVVNQIFKSGIVAGRETALKDGMKGEPLLPEQAQIALCASNVSGENHCSPFIVFRSVSCSPTSHRTSQDPNEPNDVRSQP
jgi:hypothetical protein